MESAQFVSLLTNVLMLVFLWSMNLGQGMSFTMQQVLAPFKKPLIILLAVLPTTSAARIQPRGARSPR